jgi:RNA polymerase sigma-70 factor (ECF subfamily)
VTDEELMRDVRKGSQPAFEALFERYRDGIWRFFRRRVTDAARAEELAQDTFVAILEGARRFEQRGSFRSYLFGAAYNVLLADRRKAGVRAVSRLESDPIDDRRSSPDPGIWIREAFARLDADEREILMLREYEQLSYEEIAGVLEIPINTVRSQLFRARAALKDALEAKPTDQVRTIHGRR